MTSQITAFKQICDNIAFSWVTVVLNQTLSTSVTFNSNYLAIHTDEVMISEATISSSTRIIRIISVVTKLYMYNG